MIAQAAIQVGFVAMIFWMADLSGRTDAEEIRRRILANERSELDHKTLWRWRAVGIVTFSVIGAFLLHFLSGLHWHFGLPSLLLMGFGIMASGHRWTMNAARDLKWWHMDDTDKGGNKYDEFWWAIWAVFSGWPGLDKARRQVARLAYGTEITAAILSALTPWVVPYLK